MKVNMELNDTKEVGQFIPLHYHYQMLYDHARIAGFRSAINHVVKPGDVVLELGSGTGVLSFYASEKARKVYSVEFNGELVEESRRLLALNPNGDKVEVIHGDAFEYIPPEPVNAVICEMLHVGLLREKQLSMIDEFKTRYKKHFKDSPMPIFIPTAVIQAIQPVNHDFHFEGYYAPITLFQDPYHDDPRTTPLGNPVVYHQLMYDQAYDFSCKWSGNVQIVNEGSFNAIRVITKNILAIKPENQEIIDWHNQYLIIPLEKELKVNQGQNINISFDYLAGAPLTDLRPVVTQA
ncbi:MAG: methyltransferase domain-containing protein [Defluviitaleaceae bacterium]|nr:methyltransferase domain-containing protein [Defluviitaleaceae bacterium]